MAFLELLRFETPLMIGMDTFSWYKDEELLDQSNDGHYTHTRDVLSLFEEAKPCSKSDGELISELFDPELVGSYLCSDLGLYVSKTTGRISTENASLLWRRNLHSRYIHDDELPDNAVMIMRDLLHRLRKFDPGEIHWNTYFIPSEKSRRAAMDELLYEIHDILGSHVHAYECFIRVIDNIVDDYRPVHLGDGSNRDEWAKAYLDPRVVFPDKGIIACMQEGEAVAEEPYEITHDIHGDLGARTGRIRAMEKKPEIFTGLCFFICDDVIQCLPDLILAGGGTIVYKRDLPGIEKTFAQWFFRNVCIVYSTKPPSEGDSRDPDEVLWLKVVEAKSLAARIARMPISDG